MSSVSKALCWIVCHAGPANHIADFQEQGIEATIFATGPALDAFQRRHISVIPFTSEDIEKVAQACRDASVVITDVGDPLDVTIQQALQKHAPSVHRGAYYDNFEPFVPGGYSETAEKVKAIAHMVFYANAHLATKDNEVGIGYYPLKKADALLEQRKTQRDDLRTQLLKEHAGKRVLVYFGGNNDAYFNEALPLFLSWLNEEIPDTVIVFQQHPGAKKSGRDRSYIERCSVNVPILFSEFSSDEAQVIADYALYDQTSMAPQFVLAGIPTIHIGAFQDFLVRNHLISSVSSKKEFLKALDTPIECSREEILNKLGIQPNPLEILKSVVHPLQAF